MGSRGRDAKGRRWSFSKLFLRSRACAGQVQMYICLAVHEEAVLPTFPCKALLKSLSLPYPQGHSGWSTSIAKLLSYSAGLAHSSREAIGWDQKGLLRKKSRIRMDTKLRSKPGHVSCSTLKNKSRTVFAFFFF